MPSVRLPLLSAVIFQLGVARCELPAEEAEQVQLRLRQYDDPGGHASDLADRIKRAVPRGHAVYPTRGELPFLLRAVQEAGDSLSDEGADLLESLLEEIG